MQTTVEPPCERNTEIYHDIAAGMSQRQAAEKYSVSQPMISKIVKQYKQWIVTVAPDEEFSHAQADFFATDAWCETLARGKELAYEAYQKSCMPRQAPTVSSEPGRWYPAKPEMRCLKQMIECAEKFVVASKSREQARRLLQIQRERDPAYQEEQRRKEREKARLKVAGQVRRDVAAREQREVSLAEALAILARPDLVCQLTSALTGVPPVPPDIRQLSPPTNGVNATTEKTAPAVIKPAAHPINSAEKAPAERLSPPAGENASSGEQPALRPINVVDPAAYHAAVRSAELRRQRDDRSRA